MRIKDFTPTAFIFSVTHTPFLKTTENFTLLLNIKNNVFQGFPKRWAKKPIILQRWQAELLLTITDKWGDGWWVDGRWKERTNIHPSHNTLIINYVSIYAIWKESCIYFLMLQMITQRLNLMTTNGQWLILFPVVCLLSLVWETDTWLPFCFLIKFL